MQFTIIPIDGPPPKDKHPIHFEMPDDVRQEWYDYNIDRRINLTIEELREQKLCRDVDECQECGYISGEHIARIAEWLYSD